MFWCAPQYPVDRSSMFLMGHSMGSGGTWYLGAKYFRYWAAIAPMSGPFVDETNYPWDNVREMPIFMTEGTGATPSLAGSRAMLAWMKERGFKIEYLEVNADHGAVPLVCPAYSILRSLQVQIACLCFPLTGENLVPSALRTLLRRDGSFTFPVTASWLDEPLDGSAFVATLAQSLPRNQSPASRFSFNCQLSQ